MTSPALARFWAQVLGWRILSEQEQEVVIGADAAAPVGICFMPVSDIKRTTGPWVLGLQASVAGVCAVLPRQPWIDRWTQPQ
jgi:hypothetical protein